MIVTRIRGGLGNQMFQYAYGLYLAQQNNTELVLECSSLDRDPLRNFVLDRWKIAERQTTKAESKQMPSRYEVMGWLNFLHGKQPLKRISERPFGFHPKFLTVGDNIFLAGYWQSEQFFPKLREQLQSIFQPAKPIRKQSVDVIRKMENSNSVSLHIRRGDYVQSAGSTAALQVCPLSYYQASIAELLSRHEDLKIFVFSDDHQWCSQNLQFDCPTVYVDHNDSNQSHEDMWLMTRCNHHIVANSSFSWWGAWLKLDEWGEVFAPQQWFSDLHLDASSIVPDHWHKVDTTCTHALQLT